MNESFLFDMYKRSVAQAQKAKEAGDYKRASLHYLTAAEHMRTLADATAEGELKKSRLIKAENALNASKAVLNPKGEKRTVDQDNGKDNTEEPLPTLIELAKADKSITFNDVIGLEDAKTAIFRMLINPMKNPETYAKYGLKAGGNILLEGPPGTGKTTFAKAAASEIQMPFVSVNCNALVDSYIGKTGKNIDRMFDELRALVKKEKTGVTVFFDEFDAIAKSRKSDDKTAAEAVPTLIRQLDGFDTDNSNIVIIAATNVKDIIDKAVLSRFSKSVHIPLPNLSDRKAIFLSKLHRRRISEEDLVKIDLDELGVLSEGLSGRDIDHSVTELANRLAERDSNSVSTELDIHAVIKGAVLQLINSKKIRPSDI